MFCFILGFSVNVKLFVPLLCVCALPGKAILEITWYTVSGGTFVKPYSLTHSIISLQLQLLLTVVSLVAEL